MGNHLKNVLEGIQQALTLAPDSDYVIPRRGDFRRDVEALRGDARAIADGLKKNVRRAGDGKAVQR